MEKSIRPENGEEKPQQKAGNDGNGFHPMMLTTSCRNSNHKKWESKDEVAALSGCNEARERRRSFA
jgi:hypothetical protein